MKSPVLKKSLDVRLRTKLSRDAFKYSLVNSLVIGVILYDVSRRCPDSWLWIEYLALGINVLSLLYYLGRFLYFSITWEPVVGTEAQKRLLQFDDKDSSFLVRKETPDPRSGNTAYLNNTLNFSNLSCSFNESMNVSAFSSASQNQSLHLNSQTKSNSNFASPYLSSASNAMDQDLLLEPSSLNNLFE